MSQDTHSSVHHSTASGDYVIRTESCRERVRIEYKGTWIADTSRAIILHETRLPPAYYFPLDDVRMEFLEKTNLQTYCPFKGNASYWSIMVDGDEAENAVWGYEDPSTDGEALLGYVSFYQSKISALYEGSDEVPFADVGVDSAHANPIAGWLLKDAWKATSVEQLVEQFCATLRASGVPIDRMTVIIPTLHPQIFATVLIWRVDKPEVMSIFEPHDILTQPKFADSPFAPIIRGAGGVRRRLEGDDAKLDFPVVKELHAEGATDYCAMPFRFSDAQINVMSMTSFAPGGFSTDDLGKIYEVMPALSRLFEVFAQRRTAVSLLETYLGRHTGSRVLQGQVKHGDGERIHSVIWFSDFRDSTALSESMELDTYLMHLNRYFSCVAGALIENGGEVLRFIGDAVLAIFPISESAGKSWANSTGTPEACRRAIKATAMVADRIAAANEIHVDLPPLKYGIGLHLGDMIYGNIGIPERLEFTVIGSAANEAARIESMTKETGKTVLISSSFADEFPGRLISAGSHELKGVPGRHELFTTAGD